MSTDDLARRARTYAEALHGSADAALVSELADEVDRLRAENERLASIEFIHNGCETIRRKNVQAVLEQRDAARAALERVRAATQEAHLWYSEEGRELIAVRDILNALEGES